MVNPSFDRYIGIDYSGAETPSSSLKGLRVYESSRETQPVEINPPPSPRKYWTWQGLAEWLARRLSEDVPTIVGIDHAFSFPLRYFEVYMLQPDWPTFLDDFQKHWPTDDENTYVEFIRDGLIGNSEARYGNPRWKRITEERAKAKSVFQFNVQGQVAKSTHAGLPWLLYLRNQLGNTVHFWPFDGWEIPLGKSSIVEVYPSLWNKSYLLEGRTRDQHDAYVVACRLREMDAEGALEKYLTPYMLPGEYGIAQIEGWIFGVM